MQGDMHVSQHTEWHSNKKAGRRRTDRGHTNIAD